MAGEGAGHGRTESADTSSALVPVAEPERLPARPVPVTDLVEQASETALGFALLMGDGIRAVARSVVSPAALPVRPDSEPGPLTSSRRVAVGLALDAQRRVLDTTEAAVSAVGPTARWLASNPLVQSATAPVRQRMGRAYERGLDREREARAVATRASEQTVSLAIPVVLDSVDLEAVITEVLTKVDLGPIIDRVLGQLDLAELIERVMGELDLAPIVDKVLADLDLSGLIDDVVGEISMSSVVSQATGGITEDVLVSVRNRSADGDALVSRIASRLRRRAVDELPPLAYPGAAAGAERPGEERGNTEEENS